MRQALALLAAIAVVLLVVEVIWHRRKKAERERQDAQWRATEASIRQELADPARQGVLKDVRLRAASNQAHLAHLCRTTATALGAPAAVITVVEHQGQRWLAYYGADWCNEDIRSGLIAPLETSYCQYVVATNQPLVIADALSDIRVRTATDATKVAVRAYIGAPVHTEDGVPVGSLCVFDFKPRKWSERDQAIVSSFASLVAL